MQKEILLRTLDQNLEIHLTRGKRVVGNLASHFHCAYIIGVIQKGKVELTYEDKRVSLSNGGFYIMNPCTVHYLHFLEPTDYYVMNMKVEAVRHLVRQFSVESVAKQDKQIAAALVEAFEEMTSTEGNINQHRAMMIYVLDMLANEQLLRI